MSLSGRIYSYLRLFSELDTHKRTLHHWVRVDELFVLLSITVMVVKIMLVMVMVKGSNSGEFIQQRSSSKKGVIDKRHSNWDTTGENRGLDGTETYQDRRQLELCCALKPPHVVECCCNTSKQRLYHLFSQSSKPPLMQQYLGRQASEQKVDTEELLYVHNRLGSILCDQLNDLLTRNYAGESIQS